MSFLFKVIYIITLYIDLSGKESSCNAGDAESTGLMSGVGRSSGGGNGNPLQCCWS